MTDEPRYWILDAPPVDVDTSETNRLHEVHEALSANAVDFPVVGLVDEAYGGVIAYIHAERADEICNLLQSTHEFVLGIGEYARGDADAHG